MPKPPLSRPGLREAVTSGASPVACDVAMASATDAVQIHGAFGISDEFPVARFYRDAKVLEIGEGTSEVQRMIIARELGLDA